MSIDTEIYFPYKPPTEVAPGVMAFADNIGTAVSFLTKANSPQEIQQAAKIFVLVMKIEVAEIMTSKNM